MSEMDSNSHKTAIARTGSSSPAKYLLKNFILAHPILDYGCGKSLDYVELGSDRYDPHYYPTTPTPGKYATVICTYVLNVVTFKTQFDVLKNIHKCLSETGAVYITVRRDILSKGTSTQRYVRLYEPYFENVYSKPGSFQVYKTTKDKLGQYLARDIEDIQKEELERRNAKKRKKLNTLSIGRGKL